MNNTVINVLVFIGGGVVGGVTAWLLTKEKYKKQAQEEVEEVRDYYSQKATALEKEIKDTKVKLTSIESEVNAQRETYQTIVDDHGYGEKESGKHIRVIPPEDAGELDYDVITLTYYADKVLTYDSNDKVVEDVAHTVGWNSLESFGEYEDDSVFVRNDEKKIDYEILRDYRKYSDVIGEDAE